MARKKEAVTDGQEKKVRVSVKDKARKHIDRISARRVNPNIFEAVLTAYAAVGLMKYDEVLEMSDSYANSYITREENLSDGI